MNNTANREAFRPACIRVTSERNLSAFDFAGRVAGGIEAEAPTWGKLFKVSAKFALGLVSRALPVQTAARNCMRDKGRPFGFGNQVLIPSHRELL